MRRWPTSSWWTVRSRLPPTELPARSLKPRSRPRAGFVVFGEVGRSCAWRLAGGVHVGGGHAEGFMPVGRPGRRVPEVRARSSRPWTLCTGHPWPVNARPSGPRLPGFERGGGHAASAPSTEAPSVVRWVPFMGGARRRPAPWAMVLSAPRSRVAERARLTQGSGSLYRFAGPCTASGTEYLPKISSVRPRMRLWISGSSAKIPGRAPECGPGSDRYGCRG